MSNTSFDPYCTTAELCAAAPDTAPPSAATHFLLAARGCTDIAGLLNNTDLDPLRARADDADLLWEMAEGSPRR